MSDNSTSQGEIKYVAISRVNDAQMLLFIKSANTKNAYADEYRKEVQDIVNNLSQTPTYAELRENQDSPYGIWYIYCDSNLFVYTVLTDTDFKYSNAFTFLKECAKEVQASIPRLQHDIENTPNLNICRDAIANLMVTHQDQRKNDKLAKAQDVVSQATRAMQENVKNMINNQGTFSELEDKSNNIKDTAFKMKNNAQALEREARKRNCRLWAIIICLIVSALIYIIVPLATST
ncbi:vesicle-associated membrane protein 4-like [Stylonychia lemnae]|uniref:Vesicle-associated membrane protein 4-like n=1 Tax=Stylonychia lemnae TaxID=5949 RepID=A0A078B630_STYLE|nr:vesicle-associated membrane protein 4-like [Stylonychia lemnae]|eukprot:CDW89681.1 vesicle-associated membrane protein 4-like [Stylonychia lemnae]